MLVHVDAYRLGSAEELDDLDLDDMVPEAVTVVEWGEAIAEGLADARLEIVLERAPAQAVVEGDAADDGPGLEAGPRLARVRGIGARWAGIAPQEL
jgi:tRNA threonylcarbamoyladenosine biosynthesis protein TsaE